MQDSTFQQNPTLTEDPLDTLEDPHPSKCHQASRCEDEATLADNIYTGDSSKILGQEVSTAVRIRVRIFSNGFNFAREIAQVRQEIEALNEKLKVSPQRPCRSRKCFR